MASSSSTSSPLPSSGGGEAALPPGSSRFVMKGEGWTGATIMALIGLASLLSIVNGTIKLAQSMKGAPPPRHRD
jgi:hypothetical protein